MREKLSLVARLAALALCMGVPFLTPSVFVDRSFFPPAALLLVISYLLKEDKRVNAGYFTAVLCVLVTASYLISPDKYLAAEHMAYFFLYLLVMIVFSGTGYRETSLFVVAYSALMWLYVGYQYLFIYPRLLRGDLNAAQAAILKGARFFGTFSLPNVYAFFLITAIGAAIFLYSQSRKRIFLYAGFLNLIMLVLTKTFIGYGLALIMMMWYLYRMKRRYFLPALAFLAVLTAAFVMYRGAGSLGGSLRYRHYNYLSALRIFRDHPLAGVGLNGFDLFYPAYMIPGANYVHNAHSLPLQLAADGGIFGIMVFALLFSRLTALRKDRLFPLFAVLFAYFTVDLVFYVPSVAVLFWALTPGGRKPAKTPLLYSSVVLLCMGFAAVSGMRYLDAESGEYMLRMERKMAEDLANKRFYSHFIGMNRMKRIVTERQFLENYEKYKKNWEK